ncbi:MAG: hypothetical protein K2X81_25555, partial [Candidatus Obscuribacterales bacterium]|nr:hypothetical protein [Candidatus Obscuribacterales bacterium]
SLTKYLGCFFANTCGVALKLRVKAIGALFPRQTGTRLPFDLQESLSHHTHRHLRKCRFFRIASAIITAQIVVLGVVF